MIKRNNVIPRLVRGISSLACMALLLTACGGDKETKDIDIDSPAPTPTVITAKPATIEADAAGGSFDIKITAPARPKVSGVPDWISYKDGTFNSKSWQMTVTLNVAANSTYETRSATLTVSATGAPDITLAVSQAAAEKPEPPVDPTTEHAGLSAFFGLGWNLGNHFDAYYNGSWAGELEGYPGEDVWDGEKATQATFTGVKNAGFTSVRIPVSWLKMIGDAPDYTIDETWMNRVYEVAQFAHNEGLKVIINTHHDENHGVNNTYQWLDIKNAANNSELNEQIKAKITAVWTQIATRFADCDPDWLMMEGFNELNDGGWGWSADFRANPMKQCSILNEWNQTFVDAVRATGGNNANRWLGVPSYCANPEFTQYMTIPNDAAHKVAVSVHFYDPSDYTIGDAQYSDWGHTGAADRKANGGDEDHVKSVFGNLYSNYVAKDIPVYIGEFGCSMRAKSDSRAWAFYKYYMEYIVKAAKTYYLPCFLWDNGASGNGKEQHGYINHGTGAYIGNSKEIVDIMKRAWFTESDGYTLDSVYNKAPTF